jgi:4a-hydroxytetrahydrobiopterin dehydratase
MRTPLTTAEIEKALKDLPGWRHEGDQLVREYRFESFREAMYFVVRVAFEAESLDHHPEWTNVYNRVQLKLNTHDSGDKVTGKDVELARRIQALSWVE